MAMAQNRFYISPPDPLSALMFGMQGYDAAQKRSKQGALDAGRARAGELAKTGNYQGALAELYGIGDMQSASTLAGVMENQSNRAFRESESQRAQRNADRTFGLQERTLTEGRTPAGFQRGADGSMTPIPGGPADPNYLRSTTEAKKPGGSFEDEQKLRKEFESNAKTHLDVRRGFQRVLASKDDAAGDISLIFGYMKMLDPGSVVREGEFATAQNSAGIPDQVRNMYNRALSGERLNPNQRDMFKGQSKSLYDKSAGEYSAREQQFRDIATRYGVDPARVIPSLGPEPSLPMRPAPAQPTLNLPNIPPPPPGAVIVGR
jgi:hypothetical protein